MFEAAGFLIPSIVLATSSVFTLWLAIPTTALPSAEIQHSLADSKQSPLDLFAVLKRASRLHAHGHWRPTSVDACQDSDFPSTTIDSPFSEVKNMGF